MPAFAGLQNILILGKFSLKWQINSSCPAVWQNPALFRKKRKRKTTMLLDKGLLLQFIKVELGNYMTKANTVLILNQDDCKDTNENARF